MLMAYLLSKQLLIYREVYQRPYNERHPQEHQSKQEVRERYVNINVFYSCEHIQELEME